MKAIEIYTGFRIQLRKFKWSFQLRKYGKGDCSDCSLSEESRIVVIAPHADDELIGCHAFMKKYKCHVFCCSFTGSNNSHENKIIREKEFAEYCENNALDFEIAAGRDLEQSLFNYLKRINPNVILLPSFIDWHSEHRLANRITLDCLKKMQITPAIMWYQISVPINADSINFIIPMNKMQQCQKWNSFFENYRSQKNINSVRFRFIEKKQVKKYYSGEVFVLMKFFEWQKYTEEAASFERELDMLKPFINEVGTIKNFSKTYYGRLMAK